MSDADGVQTGVFDESVIGEADERARQAVTSTGQRVESPGSLESGVRRAMYGLLSSVADNKYVLGRRYAEWCTGAPMLEAAVAAAAMAQDELGHARSFYPLLRGFPEASATDTMEEAGWQTRPTSALACLDTAFGSWSDFIAANLVVDSAFTVLFEAAVESPYEPLRQRARKIVQEEGGHWAHARGWTDRLAGDERTQASLVRSLAGVWDDSLTWYGRDDDVILGDLNRAGMLRDSPGSLRRRLIGRLSPTLQSGGMTEALLSRPLPWDRWDADARRLRAA